MFFKNLIVYRLPENWLNNHATLEAQLSALLTCDALAMLDGWQNSAGAHLEMHVAHRVGMPILFANEVVA